MVSRIIKVFKERLTKNTWLSQPTKEYALNKLDKLVYEIGYKDKYPEDPDCDFLRDDAGCVNAVNMPVTVVPIFDPNVITNTLCNETIPTPHNGTFLILILILKFKCLKLKLKKLIPK